MGGLFDNRGDRTMRVLRSAMLNVPTLWTAFVINFFTMGLIWAYVVRSYPKLEAARFWTASALVAGLGAVLRCCG